MPKGAITGYIDVAQVVLYAFWLFFAGLVFYLRREDRREGYPLESETRGGLMGWDWLFLPTPKAFVLADGKTILVPRPEEGPSGPLAAVKREIWPGAPLEPTNATDGVLGDGVGPGSYAQRTDTPDQTWEGHHRIVPMRVATEFTVAARDYDPRGMRVVGADRAVAGTVKDIWVDRGESLPRYYEVDLAEAPGRSVLLPVVFADVQGAKGTVVVEALLARQFADVPPRREVDSVTIREEDRIMAFYGAGTLYATLGRQEPLL
ncbi:photosynthetic reaction center H subunit [Methylobacterium sp. 4-46]|uniref:photosynthetic reaction center subunit H n=1 Tax=unclassified Methylobacterium TaxID=2615210 RepID=UPI000152C93A|nr:MULTISPECIES: photosynthetic reaction center subunit H [Methylobacterium]ACA18104.1 photosynthetic reaction center H subunit [Methylobacterium sp. 4-46]WFT77402.1 photosynthetic reaction center subunit H [Methylobacterium nodulans]